MSTSRLVLFCLVLAVVNGIAFADVYIWTDENGTVHMQNHGRPRHVEKYQRLEEPRPQSRHENHSRSDPLAAAPSGENISDADPDPEGINALEDLLKGYSRSQKPYPDWIDFIFKGYNLFKQDSDKGSVLPPSSPAIKTPPKPAPKGTGSNWLTTRPE